MSTIGSRPRLKKDPHPQQIIVPSHYQQVHNVTESTTLIDQEEHDTIQRNIQAAMERSLHGHTRRHVTFSNSPTGMRPSSSARPAGIYDVLTQEGNGDVNFYPDDVQQQADAAIARAHQQQKMQPENFTQLSDNTIVVGSGSGAIGVPLSPRSSYRFGETANVDRVRKNFIVRATSALLREEFPWVGVDRSVKACTSVSDKFLAEHPEFRMPLGNWARKEITDNLRADLGEFAEPPSAVLDVPITHAERAAIQDEQLVAYKHRITRMLQQNDPSQVSSVDLLMRQYALEGASGRKGMDGLEDLMQSLTDRFGPEPAEPIRSSSPANNVVLPRMMTVGVTPAQAIRPVRPPVVAISDPKISQDGTTCIYGSVRAAPGQTSHWALQSGNKFHYIALGLENFESLGVARKSIVSETPVPGGNEIESTYCLELRPGAVALGKQYTVTLTTLIGGHSTQDIKTFLVHPTPDTAVRDKQLLPSDRMKLLENLIPESKRPGVTGELGKVEFKASSLLEKMIKGGKHDVSLTSAVLKEQSDEEKVVPPPADFVPVLAELNESPLKVEGTRFN